MEAEELDGGDGESDAVYAPVPLGRAIGEQGDSAPELPVDEPWELEEPAQEPWAEAVPEEPRAARARSPERAPSSAGVIGRRLLALVVLVGSALAVLVVVGAIDFGARGAMGAREGDVVEQLAQERERSRELSAALRRESGQRYAWEQWAREFDPRRYQMVRERARRRAPGIATESGG